MLNRISLVVFLISLHAITYKLMLASILGLKTWSHVVYVVIPFVLLGYGIGAITYLVRSEKLAHVDDRRLVRLGLVALSAATIVCAHIIMIIPLSFEAEIPGNRSLFSIGMQLGVYVATTVPFVVTGFLLTWYFSRLPKRAPQLYFIDLVGAGFGALVYFVLIFTAGAYMGVIFAALAVLLPVFLDLDRWKVPATGLLVLCLLAVGSRQLDPDYYSIDPDKGWEYLPGALSPDQWTRMTQRWHPLGRTDLITVHDEDVRKSVFKAFTGTMEVALDPRPEFSYFSNNYLAGTPVYNYATVRLDDLKAEKRFSPFSTGMEVPYMLLDKPHVMVIGVGGGRDVFHALAHDARSVLGAEINPATHGIMSLGGVAHEYSGGIYTQPNVNIQNIDGRHLAKANAGKDLDLIVLNGVDTLVSLSVGAKAFAESYLYTEEAVIDYLGALNDGGMIQYVRWYFPEKPRETLRLFAIALSGLDKTGQARPWENVLFYAYKGWGLALVKKTPFEAAEIKTVRDYLEALGGEILFDPTVTCGKRFGPCELGQQITDKPFFRYAEAYRGNRVAAFEGAYPYDISVVSDDRPFFYKYYFLRDFNPFNPTYGRGHYRAAVVFMGQVNVFIFAVIFVMFFIFGPLLIYRSRGLKILSNGETMAFVLYFACLGVGFMFVEIPVIQQMVLLLGSPIYSLSVTLVALLISSGFGSLAIPRLERGLGGTRRVITFAGLAVLVYLALFVPFGAEITAAAVNAPFAGRIGVAVLLTIPVGFCLGVFFPSGLKLIGSRHQDLISWAWGLNAGFTVLGSMVAILLAQFIGFSTILTMAGAIYILAIGAFAYLSKGFVLSKA